MESHKDDKRKQNSRRTCYRRCLIQSSLCRLFVLLGPIQKTLFPKDMLLLCLYIQFSLSFTFLTFTYTQTLVDTYLLIHFCKYNQLMASYKNEKKNQIWRKTCYLWCLITKFSFPTYFFLTCSYTENSVFE